MASSGLVFQDSYGLDGTFASLTSSEQAALETDVQQAERDVSSEFTNSVTADVDIEAVNDAGVGFIASNAESTDVAVSLSSYFNALQSVATSPYQSGAVAAIESLTDLGGSNYVKLPSAYARMLGLSNAGSSFTYSSVTLSQGGPTYNLSPSADDTLFLNLAFVQTALDDQPANTPNDSIVGAVEHELTEGVMGRVSSLLTETFPGLGAVWKPADVFRVDSAGQSHLADDDGTAVFFSPEPGVTGPESSLQFNNNTSAGDLGDWTSTPTSDPNYTDPFGGGGFNGSVGTETSALSPTDMDLMNVLGWTIAPPPVVTAIPTVSLIEGQSIPASSLIASVSNPSGDTITRDIYEDEGGGSGYFTVNGLRQADGVWIYPAASDNVQYVAGSSPGSDTLGVGIFDATTNNYISASNSVVATTTYVAPVVTAVPSVSLDEGQSIPASSLASISNPSGDDILEDIYEDEGGGSGYFTVDGLKYFDGIPIYAGLSEDVQYVAGSSPGSDTLTVGIYDLTTGNYIYASHPIVATTIEAPGTPGILWRNSNGDVELWNANGSGGFTGQDLGVVGGGWQIAGTGDFNGSGEAGLLWRNASGDTALWNSNGSGGFSFQDLGVVPTSWQVAGTGDFNGSGEGILWRNSNGDTELWNPNGSGGFVGKDLGVVPTSWQIAGNGAFNGTGEDSILWRNANGDTELWNPNGSGGFVGKDLGIIGGGWQVAGTGDFTGTGEDSILWRNTNGDTELWNPNGSGGFVGKDLGVVPTSWQVAGTGDFGGSGDSSILWRNSNGDTELWNPNGSGGFVGQDLGVVGGGWSVHKAFA